MTREEAINILWRYDVNFEPHPAEEVMHAIDMAIEALRQPEQRWIPCSERVPDEYGEYLVTERTIGWNCEEYDSIDIAYFDNDRFHKAYKVTAWMPLPEPYGGEQE